MNELASKRNLIAISRGKLLVGYLMAGFPSREALPVLMKGCEKAGLDIFEIGYPSDNPVADGEVIRHAHSCVEKSVRIDLDYWKQLRASVESPIWVMAYRADLIPSGFYRDLARLELMDALVIPDADFAERAVLRRELAPMGVDVLGFVNPDMLREEQCVCFHEFPLVYQQLYSGPTGMAVSGGGYQETLQLARSLGDSKVFAGFGISTPERVGELIQVGFDGAIVGTALMRKLSASPQELYDFVRALQAPMRRTGGNHVHCGV